MEEKKMQAKNPSADSANSSFGKKIWKVVSGNPIVFLLLIAAIVVGILKDNFFSWGNLGNLLSNTAVRFLIALGVSGCLITKGTDLSAGRQVGFAAVVAGILCQRGDYNGRLWKWVPEMNIGLVFLIVVALGLCWGLINGKKVEQLVQDNVKKMNIKTPSSKTQIKSLSGGNQQKVLVGRWLANDPDVLILDEPTRGIDVGAKYEIYCIIEELARSGKSIIMISSEMGELIGMSDRIMVMCDGRVTGFIDGKDATQENIMALATQFE